MERVAQVARTDAPVLILGRDRLGQRGHRARDPLALAARRSGPVVRINCGAIPAELIDSELFGHERGSFTGAVGTRKGWFERADGGTLFLDEIGELPMAAQVRLLRVLQDGSLERVGGTTRRSRSTCASSPPRTAILETMVARGPLPGRPLVSHQRVPDPAAAAARAPARHPVARRALRAPRRPAPGRRGLTPSERDIDAAARYAWPGNVRELMAVIERAAILGDGRRLEVASALGTSDPDGHTRRHDRCGADARRGHPRGHRAGAAHPRRAHRRPQRRGPSVGSARQHTALAHRQARNVHAVGATRRFVVTWASHGARRLEPGPARPAARTRIRVFRRSERRADQHERDGRRVPGWIGWL